MKHAATILALILVLQYRMLDSPACVVLDGCQSRYSYELIVDGELPVYEGWSIAFRQRFLAGSNSRLPHGHTSPRWADLGGGITYRMGHYSISIIGTSAHRFDRPGYKWNRRQKKNYLEFRGEWK